MSESAKLSVSLPRDLVDYVDRYREVHEVSNRSQVIARAIGALRNEELIADYQSLARTAVDPLVEANLTEGLQPSTKDDW